VHRGAADDHLAAGEAALAAGQWAEARVAFDAALACSESAAALFGSAVARWWMGENHSSVERCTRAYALFRHEGDTANAVQCAVWLGIVYKANYANFAAANGWIGRADRLLESLEVGPLHAWSWIARSYRSPELAESEALTSQALEVARAAEDVDLELVALAQLGLIRVSRGDATGGFALIDEALAAALAGEGRALDTVVYTCCDMLNACELTGDLTRALQWCDVADDFVESYGCPFLYAECRLTYSSVLTARGQWEDAEHELDVGLRITEGTSPALHSRALTRLAALRIRQGRLEDANLLLARVDETIEPEVEAHVWRAALLLARGDGDAASRALEQRLHLLEEHRTNLAQALDLLVDAHIATDDVAGAEAAAARLEAIAAGSDRLVATAEAARGRLAIATGAPEAAAHLQSALATWSRLALPYEAARTHAELARALSQDRPEISVDHARRALVAFEALGASVDADRAAAFLRSAGVVPRVGPKGVGVLTAREQDVLRLLGKGLTNPEIAERLFVSRKTASHHVSRILAKLNLRNRAEAAAHAAAFFGERDAAAPGSATAEKRPRSDIG
jgi:ATP/maltotriose-dependent transcriptional regulator MalT